MTTKAADLPPLDESRSPFIILREQLGRPPVDLVNVMKSIKNAQQSIREKQDQSEVLNVVLPFGDLYAPIRIIPRPVLKPKGGQDEEGSYNDGENHLDVLNEEGHMDHSDDGGVIEKMEHRDKDNTDLESNGNIEADHNIKADHNIEADHDIEAEHNIEAGHIIEAGHNIEAEHQEENVDESNKKDT